MSKLSDITKEKIKRPKTSKVKEEVKGNLDLDEIFSGEVGDSDTKIVKELISGNTQIEQKTELTATQISIISRLYFLHDYIEDPTVTNLEKLLDKFLVLQISKDRKSRKEFVDSLRGVLDNKQGGGFLEKFGGMFKGG